jgi:putative Mg2+ transporter-C (MgtC) family protein
MDVAAITLRLALALAVGAAIGINRDLRRKPAGVRTHSLVSIGAALVVMAALAMPGATPDTVSRVVQGLITGIGFLGAGVILHHRSGQRIEGLTTAASIWVAAGLGSACGAGLVAIAVLGLAAALIVLIAGGPFERALERLFGASDREAK